MLNTDIENTKSQPFLLKNILQKERFSESNSSCDARKTLFDHHIHRLIMQRAEEVTMIQTVIATPNIRSVNFWKYLNN